jgi:H+/Cl- antiporter ClcA
MPSFTRMRTGLAKVIALILQGGGGLPLGKEGPMVHIGPHSYCYVEDMFMLLLSGFT